MEYYLVILYWKMAAKIKIRKWQFLIFSLFSLMSQFSSADTLKHPWTSNYFGSLLFWWKIRHLCSDNILWLLSVCDSFLYSSYRFHSTSYQVQESLFFFQGTLLKVISGRPGEDDHRPTMSGKLAGKDFWNVKKESMEMNSLTFENGSGLINKMLR